MKTVLMLFVTAPMPVNATSGMKTYSFDTQADLKVGEAYSTPSYAKNLLQVASIGPKDESKVLPYKIKEIIVAPAPEFQIPNMVYCTKVN